MSGVSTLGAKIQFVARRIKLISRNFFMTCLCAPLSLVIIVAAVRRYSFPLKTFSQHFLLVNHSFEMVASVFML
jgi:hypothetical protein